MAEKKTIKKETKKPISSREKESFSVAEKEKEEKIGLKKKYLKSVGRRKTAVAQVRIYKNGQGDITANNKPVSVYFNETEVALVVQPLKLTGHLRDLDIFIFVKGGGKSAQAEAVRYAIARVLILFNKELKPSLKAKGWLTRDSRKVERKKPGLKKARRAPQWSKR